MEKGQIIERGTHQSLIAAKGHYYQLYTAVERSAEEKVL
jgi:ABC-type multidrug transport system fused ATPase/permease subunit